MLSIEELHQVLLYPVVRVRSQKAGGSGVLVYSKPDSKDNRKFINIVLTCQHVVEDSISVREDWDAVLKKDVKRDFFEEINVEIFSYDFTGNISQLLSSNSTKADIIAYDKRHDIAALKLHDIRQQPYIANIISKEDINKIRMFETVWVCGCSLGHSPFGVDGRLTCIRDIIEQKTYVMASAPSIFGNSGGMLFHEPTKSLLGLTARVTGIQMGFGQDIMTWMEFSTSPERFYEFLEKQELQFLYDTSDDYYKAMERREKRKKEAIKAMFWESHKEVPSPDIKEED